jgi:hypothetical protein
MCDVEAEPDTLWIELRTAQPDDRVMLAQLLRKASGETSRDWVMSDQDERDAAHLTGLWHLLKAARTDFLAYLSLPAFSPERSAILLRGARALNIDTPWKGWAT